MADRRRISSGSPYEATIGFSRAVRVGDRIVVAGTALNRIRSALRGRPARGPIAAGSRIRRAVISGRMRGILQNMVN